jgi:RNA polymerase sigma-70 factor (ECF subfamily)
MREADDWILVARARAGDDAAFRALITRYRDPVVHFCYRMVRGRQDAEDLAQETFIRLHRHLNRLTPRAKFSTVVFGIARNLTLNHLRDTGRRDRHLTSRLEDLDTPAGPVHRPDVRAEAAELGALIEEGLNRLTPDHREILLLREMEDLDYDAIAQLLGCRRGTVKSRLARAREQLRHHLVAMGSELL